MLNRILLLFIFLLLSSILISSCDSLPVRSDINYDGAEKSTGGNDSTETGDDSTGNSDSTDNCEYEHHGYCWNHSNSDSAYHGHHENHHEDNQDTLDCHDENDDGEDDEEENENENDGDDD